MSTVEIKASIDRTSDVERCFAAAYFQHLAQNGDPACQSLLAGRMNRMDGGQKFTLEQAPRIHAALEAEGL